MDGIALLDGEHLARVASAGAGELEVPSAQAHEAGALWLRGYDLYAYALLLDGAPAAEARDQARLRFVGAVRLDPGLADGFAALLALGAERELRLPLEQALALTADRFGEQQVLSGRTLPLHYAPLFTPTLARSADDARLVYATALAVEQNEAAFGVRWAERCSLANPRTRAVLGFLATAQEQWGEAIDFLESVVDDVELGLEASFLCGVAWEGYGFDEPARRCFERALERRTRDTLTLDIRYALANLHERCGGEDIARGLLADIYASQPDYADVAVRLGFSQAADEIAPPDEADWQRFRDSLGS